MNKRILTDMLVLSMLLCYSSIADCTFVTMVDEMEAIYELCMGYQSPSGEKGLLYQGRPST